MLILKSQLTKSGLRVFKFRRIIDFDRHGHHIQITRLRKPTCPAVVKQRIPFIPRTIVVLHLKPSDQGKALSDKCAAGSDLKRTKIFQQCGIAAGVDNAVILPHQHAVAIAAHQRHGRSRMRFNRCAAAWTVGFEERSLRHRFAFSEWVGVFQTALMFISTGFINDFRLETNQIAERTHSNDSKGRLKPFHRSSSTLL